MSVGESWAHLLACDDVAEAFGVRSYRVKTVKVLHTEFCAAPQIPHADDFCNRELFGVLHLLPNQVGQRCSNACMHAHAALDWPRSLTPCP